MGIINLELRGWETKDLFQYSPNFSDSLPTKETTDRRSFHCLPRIYLADICLLGSDACPGNRGL